MKRTLALLCALFGLWSVWIHLGHRTLPEGSLSSTNEHKAADCLCPDHSSAHLAAAALRIRSSQGLSGAVSVPPQAHAQAGLSLPAQASDWRQALPMNLSFRYPEGTTATFQRTSLKTVGERQVWTGRHPSLPGAFLVGAASKQGLHALVVVPGMPTYEIAVGPDGEQTFEVNDSPLHCATCADPVLAAAAVQTHGAQASGSERQGNTASLVVDVVFIYDSGALNEAKGDADFVANRLLSRLEAGNAMLANSLVTNFSWNFVGAYHIAGYTRTGALSDDLNELSKSSTSLGGFAKEKADLTGADQIVLIVGEPIDWGGLAWMPGNHSVIGWSQTPYYTIAHELAHNFGCNHDRSTAAAPDSDGKFNYGFRYVDAFGLDTGTVMSYANERIPYFSNPSVTYDGRALGVVEGSAKAANNAKKLRDYAPTLAATRAAVSSTPAITLQPVAQTATAGKSVTLQVGTTGRGLTYQWYKEGKAISGATDKVLTLPTATSLDSGLYHCVVSHAGGTIQSSEVEVNIEPLWSTNAGARLVNLSTRSLAATGVNAQIAGFVIGGTGLRKEVLVRASGPSLGALGVPGTLGDPFLELRNQATDQLLVQNDQWGQGNSVASMRALFSLTGAFDWGTGTKDAAVVTEVDRGNYTGVVTSVDSSQGVSLIEVYETNSASTARLINISTRSLVGRDGTAQIAGFVVGGTGLKTLLIRASGPALGKLMPGTTCVADPYLKLFRQGSDAAIAENDDWGTGDTADITRAAQNSGAFAWSSGSLDAALLVTLRPGAYTAMVQAKGDTAVGLIEVYDVNK